MLRLVNLSRVHSICVGSILLISVLEIAIGMTGMPAFCVFGVVFFAVGIALVKLLSRPRTPAD